MKDNFSLHQKKLAQLLSHHLTGLNEQKNTISFFRLDKRRKLISFFFSGQSMDSIRTQFDRMDQHPIFIRKFSLLDSNDRLIPFRLAWFAYDKEETVQFLLCHKKHFFFLNDVKREVASLEDFRQKKTVLPLKSRLLLFIAKLGFMRKKYFDSWLFADRDFKADDNAEHMYRWMQKKYPDKKCFFALRKDSPDWFRLKSDGFHLIPMKSLSYTLAFIHCEAFLSSTKSGYITKPRWREWYAPLISHLFCCLKHGVTKDYSPLLNCSFMDMLVTATKREQHAFAHDERYAYLFSDREVVLTGFPRHDSLLAKAVTQKRPSTILLMPTWRKTLVGKNMDTAGGRPYAKFFSQSLFFAEWQRIISSVELHQAAQAYGYRLKFYPHPGIRQQMKDFDFNSVELLDDSGGKIQDILVDTALLITDYSSIAMDIALLGRAMVYFQFDKEDFFTVAHSYTTGYFNYEKDGFGDICFSHTDVIARCVDLIQNKCVMPQLYERRAKDFFCYADQNSCRRVYEEVMKHLGTTE